MQSKQNEYSPIFQEFIDYVSQGPIFNLKDICFDKQYEFIKNEYKLKALFCTRRAAKSYTGGIYLVSEALRVTNSNCLYVGLTRLSAKGIVWKDVLKDIDSRNTLGMKFNGSELTATFKNGSVIYVTGADADAEEMEKLLGKKYRLVIIDEAASFTIDLRRLCYGILKPATADDRGTICLLGTSGNVTAGLFFDITTGKEPGWKLFEWTAFDNPYVAKQWQEELDDIRNTRPLFMETSLFKQWYLNEWVIDEDKRVYKFNPDRNEYEVLPAYGSKGWTFILGVDLGYDPDPSAFVLVCFHRNDRVLYILECYKKKEMDITDVANRIKWYTHRFDVQRIVIDGANKQAVMEIQRRHEIALTSADKVAKVDFIQIMNSEFIQGFIKVSADCHELKDEYARLVWDDRSLKKQEHPNCANHLCDAALYSWRYCYQYLFLPAKVKLNLNDPVQYAQHSRGLIEKYLDKQVELDQENERNNDIWNTSMLDTDEDIAKYYVNKRK